MGYVPVVYRNTDLSLRSRTPLDALLVALRDRVLVLHHTRARGVSICHLDVNGSGLDRTPGRTIRRWVDLLSTLRGEPRRVLLAARPIASIGVDAEQGPTTVVVDAEDVAALARAGVGIEVVVRR